MLLALRGDFELTRGDGMWALRARRIVEEGLVAAFGAVSSQGIPVSSLGAYLHALAYRLSPSLEAIQTAVIVAAVLTHAVLLRTARELRAWTGVAASVLFFLSPAFFVFFDQKLWCGAYVPLFTTLSLWGAIRYAGCFRWKALAFSYGSAVLAVGLGYSAAIILPLLLLLPLLQSPRKQLVSRALIAGLPLAAGLCCLVVPRFRSLTGLTSLLDLFPAFNAYVAAHIGFAFSSSGSILFRHPALSLECAAYFLYLAHSAWNWRELAPEEHVLFLWNWVGAWLFVLSGLLFDAHPHHWAVALFPAPFLGIAVLLQRALRSSARPLRIAAASLALIMAGSAAFASFSFARFVRRGGGIAWHMASIGEKSEVLRWIHAQAASPRILLEADRGAPWWDYGLAGWTAAELFRFGPGHDARRGPTFLIHEPLGVGASGRAIRALARLPSKDFRSVRVYALGDARPPVASVDILDESLSRPPFGIERPGQRLSPPAGWPTEK